MEEDKIKIIKIIVSFGLTIFLGVIAVVLFIVTPPPMLDEIIPIISMLFTGKYGFSQLKN